MLLMSCTILFPCPTDPFSTFNHDHDNTHFEYGPEGDGIDGDGLHCDGLEGFNLNVGCHDGNAPDWIGQMLYSVGLDGEGFVEMALTVKLIMVIVCMLWSLKWSWSCHDLGFFGHSLSILVGGWS